jgi:hypothetical protein
MSFHTIVTILADGGRRYMTKLFSPAFLEDKGLPTPDWLWGDCGGATTATRYLTPFRSQRRHSSFSRRVNADFGVSALGEQQTHYAALATSSQLQK